MSQMYEKHKDEVCYPSSPSTHYLKSNLFPLFSSSLYSFSSLPSSHRMGFYTSPTVERIPLDSDTLAFN